MTTLLDDLLEAKEEAETDFSPGVLSAVASNQTGQSDPGQAQCRAGVSSSVHLFILYILLFAHLPGVELHVLGPGAGDQVHREAGGRVQQPDALPLQGGVPRRGEEHVVQPDGGDMT